MTLDEIIGGKGQVLLFLPQGRPGRLGLMQFLGGRESPCPWQNLPLSQSRCVTSGSSQTLSGPQFYHLETDVWTVPGDPNKMVDLRNMGSSLEDLTRAFLCFSSPARDP